jgi:hypothetical protein
MDPLTTNQAIQLAILAAMVATGGPFATLTLRLFVNQLNFSNTTALTDLTEATFTGYTAAAAQVFGTPYIAPDGNPHLTAPSTQFTAGALTTPETVYGYYLTNAAGTSLVAGGTLAIPVPITKQYDGLTIEPDYAFGQ